MALLWQFPKKKRMKEKKKEIKTMKKKKSLICFLVACTVFCFSAVHKLCRETLKSKRNHLQIYFFVSAGIQTFVPEALLYNGPC